MHYFIVHESNRFFLSINVQEIVFHIYIIKNYYFYGYFMLFEQVWGNIK